MLPLLFGDTVLAVSTVLVSFMAGLALGSFWGGRYVDRQPRVLALYAASIGKIQPFFTQPHLPASAHPLPPCSRWCPRLGSARPPGPPWWPPARQKEGLLPTR
jgi:hypothetical protein